MNKKSIEQLSSVRELADLVGEVVTPLGVGVFERKLSYEGVTVYAYKLVQRPSLLYLYHMESAR